MKLEEEFKRLENIAYLKATMDSNIKNTPEFYMKRMQLLDGFFSKQNKPVDIAFILHSAFNYAHHLAYHMEENNILFYRPKASHKRKIETAFLRGEPNIERTILICDDDMVTGNAMTETSQYFMDLGYNKLKIFGYLDHCCNWREPHTPELMHIEDLLKK